MKYFLRKDYVSNSPSKLENESQLLQLYIEFIFRTRANKCKSLWKEFIQKDSLLFENLSNESTNELQGYGFYGLNAKVFTDEFQRSINSKVFLMPKENEELLNALIYEKYHAEALFELIRQQDEDSFNMSKFGSEYKNSIIFSFPLFEEALNLQLIDKFYELYPSFPKILSVDTKLDVLSLGIIKIINDLGSKHDDFHIKSFLDYCLFSNKVINVIQEYVCFSDKLSCANGITLPVWIVKNHSKHLIDYLEKMLYDCSNESKIWLIELVKHIDNQMIERKNVILRGFR